MIIGIGGIKESGKDTFAKLLEKHFVVQGRFVNVMAFSDRLYNICEDLYRHAGFESKYFYDLHKEEKEKPLMLDGFCRTPRQILIDVGEELKVRNPRAFIDPTMSYAASFPPTAVSIITDVRFPLEFEGIAEKQGDTVWMSREGLDKPTFPDDLLSAKDFDFIIKNTTLEYLDQQAKMLAEVLG